MKKILPGDRETMSQDVVAQNRAQLMSLFPETYVEGKFDFDTLKQLLGGAVDELEEKYGLNWHGKRQARQISLTPSLGTLRPCPEESVDWEKSQNLLVEGDNLEVLKLLQKSFARQVTVIYIDPPYNTGKDFVYPDDFHDNVKNYQMLTGQIDGDGRKLTSNTEANGRFHTEWLTMMYPRLKLARNLLRDDGVILISIDDHELENLRCLSNEIFGEENFVACMTWEKGRKNDAKLVSVGHEYVLIYAKSIARLRELKRVWREEKPGAREIWEMYVLLRKKHLENDRAIEVDLQQWYSSLDKKHPAKKWSRYKRVDSNGPWRDRDISWPGSGGPRYDVLHPTTGKPCQVPEAGWRFATAEEMQRQIKLGLVEFRGDHSEPPFRKAHIRPIPAEIEAEEISEDYELEDGGGEDTDSSAEDSEEEFATQVRGSYFYKQSQVAVKYLRRLMGAKVFNNPKDHLELAKLFDYVTANDQNAVVLDFFAGSGSSGQAVLELNVADGGNRRYVMVQLPEPLDPSNKDQKSAAKYCDTLNRRRNIAEITKERLIRASQEIKANTPSYAGDLGFRVFKLDTSNINSWSYDREPIDEVLLASVEHIKSERNEEDVLYELLLKLGLDPCVPIVQRIVADKVVHSIGAGSLFVCLSAEVSRVETELLAMGIIEWYKQLSPAGETSIVFRDSAFADDVTKTNITAILQQHGLTNVRSL